MKVESKERSTHALLLWHSRLNHWLHSTKQIGTSRRVEVGGKLSVGATHLKQKQNQCHMNDHWRREKRWRSHFVCRRWGRVREWGENKPDLGLHIYRTQCTKTTNLLDSDTFRILILRCEIKTIGCEQLLIEILRNC